MEDTTCHPDDGASDELCHERTWVRTRSEAMVGPVDSFGLELASHAGRSETVADGRYARVTPAAVWRPFAGQSFPHGGAPVGHDDDDMLARK